MASGPTIRVAGLYTYPNNLGEGVPKGSLAIADNIVIDADFSAQSRRGFDKLTETIGSSTNRVNRLFVYQAKLLAHYGTNSLAYRVPGVGWTTYSGTYPPPDSSLAKTKSIEANSNFYFTTSSGVYKLDAYNNTPSAAGGLKGLDVRASLVGAGTGFLTNNVITTTTGNTHTNTTVDNLGSTAGVAVGAYVSGSGIPPNTTVTVINSSSSVTISNATTSSLTGTAIQFYSGTQVAYRVVWGLKDANENLVLGVPSQQTVVTNVTPNSSDVVLSITVPSTATVNHLYQVYRSPMTVAANVVPNDELQLVFEGNPTSSQITAKTITFTDQLSDSLRGATIYTAASQETFLQANEIPPLCKDLALFKGSAFFANCTQKQRLTLTLTGVGGTSGIASGDTVTINGVTYTGGNYVSTTGTTSSGTNTITSVGSTTGVSNGFLVSGPGIPPATTITNISGTTVTISNNATSSGSQTIAFSAESPSSNTFAVVTTGTPSQNITDTVNSLIRVINQSTSNTQINAIYLSAATDLPGKFLLEARLQGMSTFAATASAHGSTWDPALPTSGTSVSSSASVQKNAIYISKTNQPEAVPLTNVLFAGSAAYDIRRIVALRDSVFILKDDGIFKIAGQTPANFYVDLFDNTSTLLAPDSAVNLNNTIYCLTNQGVVSISETGVSVVSRPIEGDLLALFGANLSNVQNLSWGVSYQSDRKYLLGIISNGTDTAPTQIYVYNLFTNAWTRWPLSKTCGLVSTADNKLYFGDALSNSVNVERKNYDYTDYVDDTFSVTITASISTRVTLTSVAGITVGDLLYQSVSVKSVITAIDAVNNILTLQDPMSWAAGSATVYKGISCTIQWQPQTDGSPEELKQFSELELFFKRARFNQATLGFYSDISQFVESVPIMGVNNGAFGLFPFGGVQTSGSNVPFGGSLQSLPIRTYVPRDKQRSSQLNISFTHRVAYGDFVINGLNLKARTLSQRTTR